MSGHGEKLSRKQESAIAALLTHRTVHDAADAIGVSDATLCRWMDQPAFAEAYQAARRAVVSQAIARLQRACAGAVDTLEAVASDVDEKGSARVAAAKAILEMSIKAIEMEEVIKRVAALEEIVNERQKSA